MAYALIARPKNVTVTRALAAEWRDLTPAPADRPLSAARIAVYRKLVAMGLFRPSDLKYHANAKLPAIK